MSKRLSGSFIVLAFVLLNSVFSSTAVNCQPLGSPTHSGEGRILSGQAALNWLKRNGYIDANGRPLLALQQFISSVHSNNLPDQSGLMAIMAEPWNMWTGGYVKRATIIIWPPTGSSSTINLLGVGVYQTNFGRLTLNRSGNSVTGKYANGKGSLKGQISGNTLRGTYIWDGNKRYEGTFEMKFSRDGSSFDGSYQRQSPNTTGKRNWDGTRLP